MTETRSESQNEAVINEALGIIDAALAKTMQRELLSSGEVADVLLDVRTLLTTEPEAEVAESAEPLSDFA